MKERSQQKVSVEMRRKETGAPWWVYAIVSAAILIPCFWHREIEAGDLASHAYNAWLAQLIASGKAPGLYLSHQLNNVLFDVLLFHAANLFGFVIAQKVVVSLCVLIFFWGVFAFVATACGRRPWALTPCMAMLAYGYCFNMGFFNFYLSLGLGCFALALIWERPARSWRGGAVLLPLIFAAHPLGAVWLCSAAAYRKASQWLEGYWRLGAPIVATCGVLGIFWYLARAAKFLIGWPDLPFYARNGADQIFLYGPRYQVLGIVALVFGVVSTAFYLNEYRRRRQSWWPVLVLSEFYLLAFLTTALLPEDLRPGYYAGWVGLLVSRLTAISAILGFCVLGALGAKKIHFAGFAVIAAVFFVFLYQDTTVLSRLESNAEALTAQLPVGTRVMGTIFAPADSRIQFIDHVLDRACIGRCFNFGNYEASSGQFRVRVSAANPIVTASADDSEAISGGDYDVEDQDLPLKEIYQCDAADFTKLCIRDLESGEKNGRLQVAPDH